MESSRGSLVCGALVGVALVLSACGGAGGQQRDDELATLRERQELLMLFAACGDAAKEQMLSELAPELGLKARCDELLVERAETQAAAQQTREDLRERSNTYWNQHSRE